ncbi:HNH endonuclease [Alcanivorax sp. DP30]|uniref:HNH endonuclease n=1 Tax=Alcanivorax sp. DP30 TaxID=2606217 RepID=UPI001928826D|nr:hypothetical protein [Alcanivorax sp. DP30]
MILVGGKIGDIQQSVISHLQLNTRLCVMNLVEAMANNWNIPADLEREVRKRDRACVYCGNEFLSHKESAKASASWEHIINDASIITRENICLCCRGCNASKGQKKLSDWLLTNYCKERGIAADTVAPIIKQAIENGQ